MGGAKGVAKAGVSFGDRRGGQGGVGGGGGRWETAEQRQRENETREGSNNRERRLSSAALMSAGNSCFGVLMTDGCFLLWVDGSHVKERSQHASDPQGRGHFHACAWSYQSKGLGFGAPNTHVCARRYTHSGGSKAE